jgi:hypothetical protein
MFVVESSEVVKVAACKADVSKTYLTVPAILNEERERPQLVQVSLLSSLHETTSEPDFKPIEPFQF